jgi:hypothetical protein
MVQISMDVFCLILARAYMSLYDRYDQNEAELFLRDTCFVSTPQRRFEDLFEQIHQNFPPIHIFSNSEECLRNKEAIIKNVPNGSVRFLEICKWINSFVFLL